MVTEQFMISKPCARDGNIRLHCYNISDSRVASIIIAIVYRICASFVRNHELAKISIQTFYVAVTQFANLKLANITARL